MDMPNTYELGYDQSTMFAISIQNHDDTANFLHKWHPLCHNIQLSMEGEVLMQLRSRKRSKQFMEELEGRVHFTIYGIGSIELTRMWKLERRLLIKAIAWD